MGTKKWRPWRGDDCVACGSSAEVYTEQEEGWVCDDDEVRCSECHYPGRIAVEDVDEVWVNWHGEQEADEDCQCEHCQRRRRLLEEYEKITDQS